MTEPILGQIERYAPGFRDRILSIHATTPADLEAYNANDVGGDISGGLLDLRQLFTRPTLRLDPYSTPDPAIFLCSASTPPGGGVHGMSGYHAARSALRVRGAGRPEVTRRTDHRCVAEPPEPAGSGRPRPGLSSRRVRCTALPPTSSPSAAPAT